MYPQPGQACSGAPLPASLPQQVGQGSLHLQARAEALEEGKGDVGNAIHNTYSKTTSAIFSASNGSTGVFLLP